MAQEWSLTPQAQVPQRKGKGMLITGIVLLGVGVVMGVVGIIGIVGSLGSALSGLAAPATAPSVFVASLNGGGSYAVYQLNAGATDAITVDDVKVTDPTGAVVPLTEVPFQQTTTTNGSTAVIVGDFTAPVSGSYDVEVAVEGVQFAVGPGIAAFASLGVWGALIGFGSLFFLVGLVLLIIGAVRLSSSKKRIAAATAYGYGGAYGTQAPQAYPTQQAYPVQPQQPAPYPTYGQPTTAQPAPAESITPPAPEDPFAAQPQQPETVVTPVEPTPAPTPEPTPPPQPAQALPPAGWYPDPAKPGGQRYWDGQQWTSHTA